SALMIDDAAGGRDDERAIGELELADAILDDVAPHAALARYGGWHAEEKTNEVGVVHVQIDKRSADLFGIIEVFEPERIGNHALEAATEELAIFTAGYGLPRKRVFGQQRQAVADEDLLVRVFSGLHDLVTLGRGEAHGLFDEDVLAGAEGGDRGFGVQIRRQADIDEVDRRIVEEPIKARVLRHVTDIDFLARRAEIALDSPPVAAELSFVSRADGRKLDPFRLLVRKVVNPTHEADAGETNT